MAVPAKITKSIPPIKKFWLPLLNLVGRKGEFRIIVTSPDYVEFRVLWGLISFEKGETREFFIRGTEAYVKSIISSLEKNNLNARIL